jgi:hypothetical protein
MMTVRLDRRLELMTKAFEAKKDGIEKQQDLKDKQELEQEDRFLKTMMVFGLGCWSYGYYLDMYGSKGP